MSKLVPPVVCAGIVAAVLGSVSAAASPATAVYNPGQWSMSAVAGRVPEVAASARFADKLSVWYVANGVVHVGLTSVSASDRAALVHAFGPSTVVTAQARPVSDVKTVRVANDAHFVHVTRPQKGRGGGAGATGRLRGVTPATPPTQTYPNRLLDATPYFGGDQIISQFTYQGNAYFGICTANTEVTVHSTGAKAALTAGHCGVTGTVFSQGYYDDTDRKAYVTGTYGTVSTRSFGGTTDAEILAGGTLAPTSYLNTQYVIPSQTAINRGAAIAGIGTGVCTDGSFTNLSCGGTVIATNLCVNETNETTKVVTRVCGLDEATASHSLSQGGDSGGPVFAANSPAGTEILDGVISGGGNDGDTLYFAAIATVNSTLGTGQVNG